MPGSSGISDAGFFDRIIVLSLRKIEEALNNPSPNPNLPSGIMGIGFMEPGFIVSAPGAISFTGRYVLYLRVERVQ